MVAPSDNTSNDTLNVLLFIKRELSKMSNDSQLYSSCLASPNL